MSTSVVNALDLLDPNELHSFLQKLLDEHGETPEQLMVLLVKLTTAKAILEDALELEEPLVAIVDKEVDNV
ncbi:hypothetical protein PHB09_102 [Pseudomonas phage PHB09]|uniref:Uncharacterized protein n=1 Tax=Pseudomonas phage PHB09 TaxID=2867265 RepID=A0AAE8XE14_9CAUD|nr:hypothetical protein QGX10_gp101 [Pseudomonas phage PHB09]UAV84597.1 hypothetical protein PHB09_102 [Pseudomonas phage PHB09]